MRPHLRSTYFVYGVLDVVDIGTRTITLSGDTHPGRPGGGRGGRSVNQFVSLVGDIVLAVYPASGGTSVAMSPDGALAYVTDKENGWVRVLSIH